MRNAVCIIVTVVAFAVASAQGEIIFSSDFSGTIPWNFDTENNPSNQLGGTDELVYSGAINNVASWVTKNIAGGTVFPDPGTGMVVMTFKLDLSNYPTTNSDFGGRTFIEIATGGNKSAFTTTLGKLFGFSASGFNTPGQYRFGQSLAWLYAAAGSGIGGTSARTIGNRPAFPLVYVVTNMITVDGNDTDGWTVYAKSFMTGPIDSIGTIGTQWMTSQYTVVNTSVNGLKSITGLRVGSTSGSYAPGDDDSIVIDDVVLDFVPEPAAFGLLGFAALAAFRRRG